MKKTLFLAAVLGACMSAQATTIVPDGTDWSSDTNIWDAVCIGTAYGEAHAVTSNGATVTMGDLLYIGGKGAGISSTTAHDGSLTVAAGTTVDVFGNDGSNFAIGVGNSSYGGTGVLDISGTVNSYHTLIVGSGKGTGEVIIRDGGELYVDYGQVTIGHNESHGSGTVTVKNGGTFTTAGDVPTWVGYNGKGKLIIEADSTATTVELPTIYVGGNEAAGVKGNGVVELIGSKADMATETMVLGNKGSLTLTDGASLDVGTSLTAQTSTSSITVSGQSASITGDGEIGVTKKATMDVLNGGSLDVAKIGVDGGKVLVDGAISHVKADEVAVDDGGRFDLSAAASATLGDVTVEDGSLSLHNVVTSIDTVNLTLGDGGHFFVDDYAVANTSGTATVGSGASVRLVDEGVWNVGNKLNVEKDAAITFEVTDTHVDTSTGDVGVGHIILEAGASATLNENAKFHLVLPTDVLDRLIAGETHVGITMITGNGVDNVEVVDNDGTPVDSKVKTSINGNYGIVVETDKDGKYKIFVDPNPAALTALAGPGGEAVANTILSAANSVGAFSDAIMAEVRMPRQGDHRLWGVMLAEGDRVNREGDRSGYHYNGGGYTVGYDHNIGKRTYVGVALGQMYGVYTATHTYLHDRQTANMVGVYGHTDWAAGKSGDNQVNWDSFFTYGRVHNKARGSVYYDRSLVASGSWDTDVFKAGTTLSYDFNLDEHTRITPYIGLTLTYADEEDVTLKNGTSGFVYKDGSYTNLTMPVGVRFAKIYDMGKNGTVIPQLSVAYLADLARNDAAVKTEVTRGVISKIKGVTPGRNGVMAEVGTTWVINPQWTTGLFYTVEHRRRDTDHTVHAHVSYGF